MRRRWIVTALGQDRPGIVAGITKVLYRLGGNLEDSAMTRLGGAFAVMLLFSGPARLTRERVQSAFGGLLRRLNLAIRLTPVTGSAPPRTRRGRTYLITVYGADRPGIVYRISELLARSRINITDVETHRSPATRSRAKPLYLMLLDVELPQRVAVSQLVRRLNRLAKALRVEVTLRSAEADVL